MDRVSVQGDMMQNFHLGFDPGSLDKLVRMEGFAALLNPEVTNALTEAGTLLVSSAQANTWAVFANPTGALADSITFYVVSPTEVDLIVGVPYGRRREFGFEGLYDSLGRGPFHDPPKPYLQPAIDDNKDAIRDLMATAVYNAWGEV